MRATARLARCIWELSKSGKIREVDIYRQMAIGNQMDKEFTIGGSKLFVRFCLKMLSMKLLNQTIYSVLASKEDLNKLYILLS